MTDTMTAAATLDPEHVAITEPVKGSDIPVRLMYVELIDGVYAPIGLRVPAGKGPFPLVVFAAGNGGGGMAWIRNRAEVDYAYDKIGALVEDKRQRRQLLNRGPLEYEDAIAIIKYLKTLPFIAANRIGYMGMSHGGEMAFKIASEYDGVA